MHVPDFIIKIVEFQRLWLSGQSIRSAENIFISVSYAIIFCFTAVFSAAEETNQTWKYSPEILRPFWHTKTMYGESVLFIKVSETIPPRACLLFKPNRIKSIRSSSGSVEYKEGRDYLWKTGSREIILPPDSKIVFKTPQDLRRPAKSQQYALTHRDGNGEILFGASHEYHDIQTVVTYEHERGEVPDSIPTFEDQKLSRTIQKLKNKQPIVIALLGDSISTGCNASGWANTPPYQPPYQDLLAIHLEATYRTSITLTNFAVGGTDTAWGLANIGKVADSKPDLVILAFGMNDAGGRPAKDYQANIEKMMEIVSKSRPDSEFILIATMLGNKDWIYLKQELFLEYRDSLKLLCGPGVALADMTSIWQFFFKHKMDWDLTGNGVNHPNDFGHRVYAQVLSALLIPEK